MAEERTMYKITCVFEVELDETDEEDKERRYQASCRQLTGCTVHASSKRKALHKIRKAIAAWLDMANRQFNDDSGSVTEWLDMAITD